jgi:hypothetical protein
MAVALRRILSPYARQRRRNCLAYSPPVVVAGERLEFISVAVSNMRRSPPADCADDEAVIHEAKQLLDGHAIEVWDLARLIVRLEPGDH